MSTTHAARSGYPTALAMPITTPISTLARTPMVRWTSTLAMPSRPASAATHCCPLAAPAVACRR